MLSYSTKKQGNYTMKYVLQAENVKKTYGKKIALDGVNFDLQKGEIHSLLGPNGAGKTTLIKIMATLLIKDSGVVNVLGYDLDTQENEIKHVLGYVGQDTERSAYARLTVKENLRFFGSLRGLSKDYIDNQIGKLSEYFDFEENVDKQFNALSGGQKQAVVIMRALLHDPPVIFLDEPTKGLDVIIAKRIRNFLKDYSVKEGKSLLLTSHIMSEVEELSNRVSLINKGKIGITGSPTDLKMALGVQDFVEVQKEYLPETTLEKIQNLSTVKLTMDKHQNWYSFGVQDLLDATEDIIKILRADGVKTGFRHSAVSLEDAFIHHVGSIGESFEV
jgi:ABC-2 type transport system ATP-binding protein